MGERSGVSALPSRRRGLGWAQTAARTRSLAGNGQQLRLGEVLLDLAGRARTSAGAGAASELHSNERQRRLFSCSPNCSAYRAAPRLHWTRRTAGQISRCREFSSLTFHWNCFQDKCCKEAAECVASAPLRRLCEYRTERLLQVVYVSRNPKDNAVSFYHFHQMARFLGQQMTTWNEFFALYTVGKSAASVLRT